MKDRGCVETELGLCKWHMQTAEPNEKASFGLSGLTLPLLYLHYVSIAKFSTVMFLARSI